MSADKLGGKGNDTLVEGRVVPIALNEIVNGVKPEAAAAAVLELDATLMTGIIAPLPEPCLVSTEFNVVIAMPNPMEQS